MATLTPLGITLPRWPERSVDIDNVNSHKYPWQVNIIMTINGMSGISIFETACGGTLISPSYILTSAFCFKGPTDGWLPKKGYFIFRT
jgi:secreted trypsin-like serine protease